MSTTTDMTRCGLQQLEQWIQTLSDTIVEKEQAFCELDSVAGDGDFGMSLSKGFRKIQAQWSELNRESCCDFLRSCSRVILEFCGGATGPLWGGAFRGAARRLEGIDQFSPLDLAEALAEAAKAIQKRGGARLGDKTLLDALIPAADAMKQAAQEGADMAQGFRAAAKAARAGADHTRTIVAQKGRASYLAERSLNHPDAGAEAIAVLLETLVDRYFKAA